MNIKKDDKVVVLSGKDKGKEGKVLSADPKGGKLIVEGVNVATKHQKPKNQQDQGGEDDLLTKLRDRSMPARSWSSARSAASRPALRTRSPTARKSASARSAAPNCKGGSNELWQICLL